MKNFMAVVASIKQNLQEYYTIFLLVVGLPSVLWMYLDWRAAVASSVVIQSAINLLLIRRGRG